MIKKVNLLGVLFFSGFMFSQQNPVNNNPSVPAQNGTNDRAFWSRAGNSQINGNNNIFGTLWNSPIYTQTNGVNRMKLNGTYTAATQYQINGYTAFGANPTQINTSGYMLLGEPSTTGIGLNSPGAIYTAKGAFSLLHLNGATVSNAYQELGYRSWMKTFN